jgi:hypothetical protein
MAGHTSPNGYKMFFGQYTCFFSQWLVGTIIGVSAKHFMSIYGSHSGRSGGVSAAANANVPIDRWGQHMGSVSRSSQLSYVQLSSSHLLSVSLLGIMRDPDNFPDEKIPKSSSTIDSVAAASLPHVQNDDDLEITNVPLVEGVRATLFRWDNSEL